MSPGAEFTAGDPSTGATQPSSSSPFSQPPSSAPSSFPSPLPPPAPRLPAGMDDRPTIVGRPTGQPVVLPLEATAPTGFVAAGSNESVWARQVNYGPGAGFSPLRSDPPPSLISTWWLRTAILLMMLAALVLTVWVEYTGEADDIGSHLLVIGLHIVIAGSIVLWSGAAMHNANKLVPPSLYQRHSNPLLAAVLWLGAFAAPRGVMLGWFFAPLMALVGGIAILALGLHDQLALDGLTVTERTIQVVVAYGLPMLMFTLTTWRAITVFDEVIDLKWRRWKVEWEQTLGDLARQPPPGPEGSPDTRLLGD
jgi:hypothetical protein